MESLFQWLEKSGYFVLEDLYFVGTLKIIETHHENKRLKKLHNGTDFS